MYADNSRSIADYLADREGLKDSARTVFIALLRNAYGFKLQRPRLVASSMGACAVAVAVFGVSFELKRGPKATLMLLWLVVAGIGLTLAFVLARAQRQTRPASPEIEWRAYCLLIRPLILVERPGLLDRNLITDRGAHEREVIGSGPSVKDLLDGDRGINLWLPAAVGWSAGAVSLVVWQALTGPNVWTFLIPLVGAIMFPLTWGVFRFSTFSRAEWMDKGNGENPPNEG